MRKSEKRAQKLLFEIRCWTVNVWPVTERTEPFRKLGERTVIGSAVWVRCIDGQRQRRRITRIKNKLKKQDKKAIRWLECAQFHTYTSECNERAKRETTRRARATKRERGKRKVRTANYPSSQANDNVFILWATRVSAVGFSSFLLHFFCVFFCFFFFFVFFFCFFLFSCVFFLFFILFLCATSLHSLYSSQRIYRLVLFYVFYSIPRFSAEIRLGVSFSPSALVFFLFISLFLSTFFCLFHFSFFTSCSRVIQLKNMCEKDRKWDESNAKSHQFLTVESIFQVACICFGIYFFYFRLHHCAWRRFPFVVFSFALLFHRLFSSFLVCWFVAAFFQSLVCIEVNPCNAKRFKILFFRQYLLWRILCEQTDCVGKWRRRRRRISEMIEILKRNENISFVSLFRQLLKIVFVDRVAKRLRNENRRFL